MPARKRGYEEVSLPAPPPVPPLLSKLRNMWEFANIMQYIAIFGQAVRIDTDFDIQDLETECLRPEPSAKLAEIGLCLLKNVSSNRALTSENFDEYTRRQYQVKKPEQNPFGDDESPKSFSEFAVEQKIRTLVDLSQWTLINPNNIREKLEVPEKDQHSEWRIEPIGSDRKGRSYFALDDNRLYRRTDPIIEIPRTPTPPPRPRGRPVKSKKAAAKPKAKPRPTPTRGTRASKRLKLEEQEEDEPEEDQDEVMLDEGEDEDDSKHLVKDEVALPQDEDDTLGGAIWECVAITLEEYQEFLATIYKSRDVDEKWLYENITENILPIIEAEGEKQRQKALRRQRELEALEKLATAKRSTRISARRQHEVEEAEARALEEKRQQDIREAQAMMKREQQMEQDRESRRLTREQRIKERELRRVIEEEALNDLQAAEAQSEQDEIEGRKSRRQLKAEIEKKRRAVEELKPDDEWVFDCGGCGVHGANLDDGSHSVACDRCNVWQHSACLGVSEADAEKEDFHLVCKDCIRKEEEAKRPKPPRIKLKVNQSSSPPSVRKTKKEDRKTNGAPVNGDNWHNTFGYPQPPAYHSSPNNFIAFKPDKYYTNGTSASPAESPTPASGSSKQNSTRAPGLPPVGKFVNYSPKSKLGSTNASTPTSNGQSEGMSKFRILPPVQANGHHTSQQHFQPTTNGFSTDHNVTKTSAPVPAVPTSITPSDGTSSTPANSAVSAIDAVNRAAHIINQDITVDATPATNGGHSITQQANASQIMTEEKLGQPPQPNPSLLQSTVQQVGITPPAVGSELTQAGHS